MASSATAGLAVTAHNNSVLNTSTLDNSAAMPLLHNAITLAQQGPLLKAVEFEDGDCRREHELRLFGYQGKDTQVLWNCFSTLTGKVIEKREQLRRCASVNYVLSVR